MLSFHLSLKVVYKKLWTIVWEMRALFVRSSNCPAHHPGRAMGAGTID